MKKILILNKREGDTPLQTLEKFRRVHESYKHAKMTYAGRLDPMASGLMLVVVGDEIKNKEKYLNLDKKYEFKVLFGFATDTYDILGKVVKTKLTETTSNELKGLIQHNLKYFTGDFVQAYPLYSSKTIRHARSGSKVKAPLRKVSVHSIDLEGLKVVKADALLKNIEQRINKVEGDFRQDSILNIWRKKLSDPSQRYYLGRFVVHSSSGTYVRGIAQSLGEKIGIPSLAFSIKRTKVGKFAKIS